MNSVKSKTLPRKQAEPFTFRMSGLAAISLIKLRFLGDMADFVKLVYIAGVRANAIPELKNLLPATKVLPDPQWANAMGFLKVGWKRDGLPQAKGE